MGRTARRLGECVVRVGEAPREGVASKTEGTGFFVSHEGHVVTCAHVVEEVLGAEGALVGATLGVTGFADPANTLAATLDVCRPEGRDIAVLRVTDGLPSGAAPARLADWKTCEGLGFQAYGYPRGFDVSGIRSTGTVTGSRPEDVQVEVEGGSPVDPGFSGAPQWSDDLRAVIGMVRAKARGQVHVAFSISARAITQALPGGAEATLLPDPLEAYRARVAEDNRYVSFEGIPLPRLHDGSEEKPRLPLDEIYIRLNVEKHSEGPGDAAAYAEARYKGRGDEPSETEVIEAERLLARFRRVVVKGEAGSGKSTLLRYLAHRAATGSPTSDRTALVPVHVSLKKYAETETAGLLEYAVEALALDSAQAGMLLKRLREREASVLWLLDGLDEVREDSREAITNAAARLSGHVVLTTRPAGYRRPGSGVGTWDHVTVRPVAIEQAGPFIQRWTDALAEYYRRVKAADARFAFAKAPGWSEAKSAEILAAIDEREGLRPLVSSPLLLTFLAVLGTVDDRSLPDTRTDLYRRYVESLLATRERQRSRLDDDGGTPTPWERLTDLVGDAEDAEAIAYRGFEGIGWLVHTSTYGDALRSLSVRQLADELASFLETDSEIAADLSRTTRRRVARAVLDLWTSTGLLITWSTKPGETYWAMRHLTFQEYATASVLSRRWGSDSDGTWTTLRPLLHHYAWQEVLSLFWELLGAHQQDDLAVGICNAGSEYEEHLHRDLYLAARLIGEDPSSRDRLGPSITVLIQPDLPHSPDLNLGSRVLDVPRSMRVVAITKARVAVSRLTELLRDEDNGVRRSAAEALGQLGDASAAVISGLLERLRDEDRTVRIVATRALEQLGGAAVTSGLLERLRDDDSFVRLSAARALGQLGDASAAVISGLLERLRDEDSDVRSFAARALGQLGDAAVISGLLERLRDDDSFGRMSAAEALEQLGDASAAVISGLLERLRDEDSDVRFTAAMALGQLGDASVEVVSGLLERLRDEDTFVRLYAADALGQLGDASAAVVSGLLERLRDEDSDVRSSAARALGQLGDASVEVVSGLLERLRDDDSFVCFSAALALGQLGDASVEVISSLLERLRDEDSDVRSYAADALGQLGDASAAVVSGLLARLRDEDSDVRRYAAEALGQLGDASAAVVSGLLERLRDEDHGVRFYAALALEQLGDASAAVVSGLLERLRDEDSLVRLSAARALGQLGFINVLPPS